MDNSFWKAPFLFCRSKSKKRAKKRKVFQYAEMSEIKLYRPEGCGVGNVIFYKKVEKKIVFSDAFWPALRRKHENIP